MLREAHLLLCGVRARNGLRAASAHVPSIRSLVAASGSGSLDSSATGSSTSDTRFRGDVDRRPLGDGFIGQARLVLGRERDVLRGYLGGFRGWLDRGDDGHLRRLRHLARLGLLVAFTGCQLAEIDRIAQDVGRVADLAHRLLGRRPELLLESARHLLELAVELPQLAHRLWQLLGPQHHQRQQQDDDQLAALQVEHAGQSMRTSRRSACQDGGRVQQRLPALLDDPITFAHRGARAHAPENTIAAFQLALEMGAGGLESDVWLTRDGVPVLEHDGVLGRMRKRRIADLTRDELPDWIPSLDDLIDACGTDYPSVARSQGATVGPAGDRRHRRSRARPRAAHMAVSSRPGDAVRLASGQPDAFG